MITAPKGRGWMVITTTPDGDRSIGALMTAQPESESTSSSRNAYWSKLRKAVTNNRRIRDAR